MLHLKIKTRVCLHLEPMLFSLYQSNWTLGEDGIDLSWLSNAVAMCGYRNTADATEELCLKF